MPKKKPLGKRICRRAVGYTVLYLLCLLPAACQGPEQTQRPPSAQSAAVPGAAPSEFSASKVNRLFRAVEEALCAEDSVAFVEGLLDLLGQPLSDSLLFKFGGLVGLGYRTIPVTDNVVADYAPRFFPDGKRIVYFSRLEREQLDYPGLRTVRYQTQICTIDIDGTHPTVISDGEASDFFPDVSADGKYIVCQRAPGDTLKGEWTAATGSILHLYDLQSDRGRRLGDTLQAIGQPQLPLGRPGRWQRLGDAELYARCPRFMPGDHEVLFVSMQHGFTGLISSINVRTGEITLRYRNPPLDKLGEPFFPFLPSPFFDGGHIAFQTGIWGQKAVFVSDSVGQEVVRLTPEELSERHPSPAPDNRTIVFVSDGRSGTELFLRRLGDTTRQQLTFDGYDKAFPAYSPDGRFIAFGAKPAGSPEADYEIYLLDLDRRVHRGEIEARVKDLARKLRINEEAPGRR